MKLKLTYFKPVTGKYYSEGEMEVPEIFETKSWMLIDFIKQIRSLGRLPGLVQGSKEWDIFFQLSNEVPHLLKYYIVELTDERWDTPESYKLEMYRLPLDEYVRLFGE